MNVFVIDLVKQKFVIRHDGGQYRAEVTERALVNALREVHLEPGDLVLGCSGLDHPEDAELPEDVNYRAIVGDALEIVRGYR